MPGSENLRCRCTSHSEDGGTSSHVTARTSVQLGSDTMVQAKTGMLTMSGEMKSDAYVIPVGEGRCAMHKKKQLFMVEVLMFSLSQTFHHKADVGFGHT